MFAPAPCVFDGTEKGEATEGDGERLESGAPVPGDDTPKSKDCETKGKPPLIDKKFPQTEIRSAGNIERKA